MSNQKALRGHVRIDVFDIEAVSDWDGAISAADLTAALANRLGADVSCAILDDYTLNQTGSDTDDSMSLCDEAASQTPTIKNYEASLDGFRSDPNDPVPAYENFFAWFKAAGMNYVLVKRISPPVKQAEGYAAGQNISLYGVETDNPTDILESASPIKLGARFKNTGLYRPNIELVS